MTTLILFLVGLLLGMFLDHYIFIAQFRQSVNKGTIGLLNSLDRFLGVKSKKGNPGGAALTRQQLGILGAAYGEPASAADIAARVEPKTSLPTVVGHLDTLMAMKLIEAKGTTTADGTPRMLYRLTPAGKKTLEAAPQ